MLCERECFVNVRFVPRKTSNACAQNRSKLVGLQLDISQTGDWPQSGMAAFVLCSRCVHRPEQAGNIEQYLTK